MCLFNIIVQFLETISRVLFDIIVQCFGTISRFYLTYTLNNLTHKQTYEWRIKQRMLHVFYAKNMIHKKRLGNSLYVYIAYFISFIFQCILYVLSYTFFPIKHHFKYALQYYICCIMRFPKLETIWRLISWNV